MVKYDFGISSRNFNPSPEKFHDQIHLCNPMYYIISDFIGYRKNIFGTLNRKNSINLKHAQLQMSSDFKDIEK